MSRAYKISILLLCVILFAATGCTSSQVRLRYVPAATTQISPEIQPGNTFGLIQFADKRTASNIGIDDGKNLTPVSNVAAWVTHGIEQKLQQNGATVHYVLNASQLENTSVRVSGSITKLWVQHISAGKYQGDITLKVKINNNPPTTYTASVTRQGVPYMNNIEPLLAELLNEALTPVIPQILAAQ